MGLIFDILSALATGGNDKNNELEKEMDNLNLEEWQKELVRKGEYSPESFEEDGELEDDDYYNEDD